MQYIHYASGVRKKTLIVIGIVIVACFYIFLMKQARANVSLWSQGSPTVESVMAKDQLVRLSECPVYGTEKVERIDTIDQDSSILACLRSSQRMKYASQYLFVDGQWSYKTYIARWDGLTFYPVHATPCDGNTREACVYLPETDTLARWSVTGRYNNEFRLYFYDKASTRFTPHFSDTTRTLTHYTFDDSTPRFSVRDRDSYMNTYSMGSSPNGRYVAAEVQLYNDDATIILIDTVDFSVKRIIDRIRSPAGTNGKIYQWSVSNDGRAVVYQPFSSHAVNIVIDVTADCGTVWNISPNVVVDKSPMLSRTCAQVEFNRDTPFLDGLESAMAGFVNGDSRQLWIRATDWSWAEYGETFKTKEYVINIPNYNPSNRLTYLALGDSISSGEGDIAINPASREKYYVPSTDNESNDLYNIPREKCHVSSRAYPFHLAYSMNLGNGTPRQWGGAACSGARTADVYTGAYDFLYAGQRRGGAPGDQKSSLPRLEGYQNKDFLQGKALNEMIPGRIQQVEFVKKYKPKIITLTMGANNIDFSSKLSSCVVLSGTCDWATTKKPSLASQIQSQYDELRLLYRELYKASGYQAKIFVLGYPQIISNAEPAACGWNIGQLNKEEREMIYDATTYLNLVIERAANAAGVKYVDISNALNGGRLCDDGQRYMTGVTYRGSNELQESFHPNHYGHIQIAAEIRSQLNHKTLMAYQICADGANNCPRTGMASDKPAIPANLGGEPHRLSKNVALTATTIPKGAGRSLQLKPFTVRPQSNVTLEVHSNPTELGRFIADAAGGLDVGFTIPNSVSAGYHTLVMTGETYVGDSIELMQTVLVTGSDPNDLDENGIPDSQQPCGPFLPVSGIDINGNDIDDMCDTNEMIPIVNAIQEDNNSLKRSSSGVLRQKEKYVNSDRENDVGGLNTLTNDKSQDKATLTVVSAVAQDSKMTVWYTIVLSVGICVGVVICARSARFTKSDKRRRRRSIR